MNTLFSVGNNGYKDSFTLDEISIDRISMRVTEEVNQALGEQVISSVSHDVVRYTFESERSGFIPIRYFSYKELFAVITNKTITRLISEIKNHFIEEKKKGEYSIWNTMRDTGNNSIGLKSYSDLKIKHNSLKQTMGMRY